MDLDKLSESLAGLDEAHLEAEKLAMDLQKLTQRLQSATKRAMTEGKAVKKEAERLLREAREEHARAQKMREEAETAMVAAQQERESALKAANALAKEGVESLQEEAVATFPVDVAAAKRFIQYEDCRVHIAVTGCVGSGKTSLVNALLGDGNEDVDASPVEVIKTMTRYSDGPFGWWYVAPRTEAFDSRDSRYLDDHRLYVFDYIVVLFDNSFTMTDIAVLVQARSHNIPTYIVCSKADHHIHSIMMEMGCNGEGNNSEEEDSGHRNELYGAAREHFIEETRRKVREKLEEAELPDQRVYIVSSNALFGTTLDENPKGTIDEADLLHDFRDQMYLSYIVGMDERLHMG